MHSKQGGGVSRGQVAPPEAHAYLGVAPRRRQLRIPASVREEAGRRGVGKGGVRSMVDNLAGAMSAHASSPWFFPPSLVGFPTLTMRSPRRQSPPTRTVPTAAPQGSRGTRSPERRWRAAPTTPRCRGRRAGGQPAAAQGCPPLQQGVQECSAVKSDRQLLKRAFARAGRLAGRIMLSPVKKA